MFKYEWGFVAADLEHAARARTACGPMAKTRIKETCVMHAKFAHQSQIRGHFGGIVWWDMYSFAADKDIECPGIKNDAPIGAAYVLSEFGSGISSNPVQIYDTGVGFGAVTNQIAGFRAQIDGKAQALIDMGRT